MRRAAASRESFRSLVVGLSLLLLAPACNGQRTAGRGLVDPQPTPPAVAGAVVAQPGQAASIRIDAPLRDTVVTSAALNVSGEVTSQGAAAPDVTVDAGAGPPTHAQVQGSHWSAGNVGLPAAENVVSARAPGVEDQLLVTRGTHIGPAATQNFRIDWTPEAKREIEAIAVDTLTQTLNATQRSAFVTAVENRVTGLLVTRFAPWHIDLVEADGPGVQTIQMLGTSGPIYGQSSYDCGNHTLRQTSEIWVGTYHSLMTSVEDWGPMSRADALQTRIEDVSQALARTSAHEFGHSLGLVGDQVGSQCGWMKGCDQGHSCDLVDQQQKLAHRFKSGRFIMDPGNKTSNEARIAEISVGVRGERSPADFSGFDASYLSILYPAQ